MKNKKEIINWLQATLFCKEQEEDVVSSVKGFKLKKELPGIDKKIDKGVCRIVLGKVEKRLQQSQSEKNKRIEKFKKYGLRGSLAFFAMVMLFTSLHFAGGDKYFFETLRNIELFHIKEIKITGLNVLDEKTIRDISKVRFDDSILFLDEVEIANRLEAIPWVSKAEVSIDLPTTLVIKVREHSIQALVLFEGKNESTFQYISKKGFQCIPISINDELDYPVITGLTSKRDINDNQDILSDAFAFLKQTRGSIYLPTQSVSELHITKDEQLILYLVDQPFPIYLGKGKMRQKHNRLTSVLEVLYRKGGNKLKLKDVGSIRMEYYNDKVLVSSN